jgi:hypothetical protein
VRQGWTVVGVQGEQLALETGNAEEERQEMFRNGDDGPGGWV